MGKKDEVLEAEKFFKNMTEYVEHALSFCTDGKVPHGLDPVDDIRNCVELTRSGLVLSKFQLDKNCKRSIDLTFCRFYLQRNKSFSWCCQLHPSEKILDKRNCQNLSWIWQKETSVSWTILLLPWWSNCQGRCMEVII